MSIEYSLKKIREQDPLYMEYLKNNVETLSITELAFRIKVSATRIYQKVNKIFPELRYKNYRIKLNKDQVLVILKSFDRKYDKTIQTFNRYTIENLERRINNDWLMRESDAIMHQSRLSFKY